MTRRDYGFVLLGAFITIVAVTIADSLPMSYKSIYIKAIDQCEQGLKEDQRCKIVGVIDDIREGD